MEPEVWANQERRKWHQYELEKQRLQRENLPAYEYEAKLQIIIGRLGI